MSDLKICPRCSSTMPYDGYFKTYRCRQCGYTIKPNTGSCKKCCAPTNQELCLDCWGYENNVVPPKSERELLTENIPFARLAQMCEAEREGRCVVLPCKVDFEKWSEGNECYITDGGDITHCLILCVAFNYKGEIYIDLIDEERIRYTKYLTDIGNSVHLTKEAAEAKGAV